MSESIAIKKPRSSNLELFRIITMLLIVAHHYVVNSGLYTAVLSASNISLANIFLLFLGAWGKPGINCFVLITGYFMCKSDITGKKHFKLLLEVMFYKITIFLIFLACGKETISLTSLLNTFLPTTSVASGFTDCFLIFYLLIPFVNILIQNLSKAHHLTLMLILLFAYTIMGSVPWFNVSFNYLSWFFVLYLIASYIRLYPCKITEKKSLWLLILLISITLSLLSILLIYSNKAVIISYSSPYYFLSDSNKLLAVCTSVSAFLFFKNINLPYIGFINAVGATTYGILLIHSNSSAMRDWLWEDLFKNSEYYTSPKIFLHALIAILLVFSVCSLIDFLRIKLIEAPALKLFDKIFLKIKCKKV